MQKKNVILCIDSETLETAKELGLNISKYCENSLINGINALTNAESKEYQRPKVVSSANVWCSGRDLSRNLLVNF